jgi:hypothetical protein
MLQELLGGLGLFALVEEPVGVDTFLTVLENGMTQNIVGIRVTVLPNQRDLRLVLMAEGPRHDGTTIRALEPRLGRPSAEICFHFDGSFLSLLDC